MASFVLKAGATLLLNLQLTDDIGTPIDVTDATITSSVQDTSGGNVTELTPVLTTPTSGQFTLGAAASVTAEWPAGTLVGDVRIVLNSAVFYTDTFTLQISGSITPAG